MRVTSPCSLKGMKPLPQFPSLSLIMFPASSRHSIIPGALNGPLHKDIKQTKHFSSNAVKNKLQATDNNGKLLSIIQLFQPVKWEVYNLGNLSYKQK